MAMAASDRNERRCMIGTPAKNVYSLAGDADQVNYL
jgi:hypothetical protein